MFHHITLTHWLASIHQLLGDISTWILLFELDECGVDQNRNINKKKHTGHHQNELGMTNTIF